MTDSNDDASVWVIASNDAGGTFTQHNLVAYGPAGQGNSNTDPWYPTGGFAVGDTITLRLEPTPVTLNGTNMDCAYLLTNPEAALGAMVQLHQVEQTLSFGKVGFYDRRPKHR